MSSPTRILSDVFIYIYRCRLFDPNCRELRVKIFMILNIVTIGGRTYKNMRFCEKGEIRFVTQIFRTSTRENGQLHSHIASKITICLLDTLPDYGI